MRKEIDVNKMDARSILKNLLSNAVSPLHGGDKIISLDSINNICGMPPMGDNVADPPAFISDEMLQDTSNRNVAFRKYGDTGPQVGSDFAERIFAGGQFLVLVPLELKPSFTGNTAKNLATKLISKNKLAGIYGRLGVADYGLSSRIASRRYWRTYTMLMQTAAISLGLISVGNLSESEVSDDELKERLPDYMYETISNGRDGKTKPFKLTDGDSSADERVEVDGFNTRYIASDEDYARGSTKNDLTADAYRSADIEELTNDNKVKGVEAVIKNKNYTNLLKYVTAIDSEVAQTNMPIITFFVNGVIERNYSTSMDYQESAVARNTTDITRKSLLSGLEKSENISAKSAGVAEEHIQELAYHGAFLTKGASYVLSNTSIPKVISSTSSDFSYTVKLSAKSVNSDPCSLMKVMDLYERIVPFITPVSNGKANTVVPQAPLYCSAFVKGVMNVPRGAITSASIVSNPKFQTSEGIPTEMDVNVTIQPLLSVSSIPNMGRYFSQHDESALVATMFNPMSALNILATMCSYNTVLTKYPFGLFDYFISGTISSFVGSIKDTRAFVVDKVHDYMASTKQNIGRSLNVR